MGLLPGIVIHGGAWAIPDKLAEKSTEGVKTAAKIGYEILMNGGSAVDAVEAAVVSMENDPAFNAGDRISIHVKYLCLHSVTETCNYYININRYHNTGLGKMKELFLQR